MSRSAAGAAVGVATAMPSKSAAAKTGGKRGTGNPYVGPVSGSDSLVEVRR